MIEKKEKGNFLKIFLTALITSLGVSTMFFFLVFSGSAGNTPPPQGENSTDIPKPQQIVAEEVSGSNTTNVAKTAAPGVVGIAVLKVDGISIFDRRAAEKWGIGSGVIVSPEGYILTNHHVAGGKNRRIVVSFAGGRSAEGTTVWSDPVLDIAVVKVDITGLTVVPLGDSNTLRVGEQAIAIGNPLGLQFQRTVTSGIISALNRTITIETEQGSNFMEDLIQTDASINPGNSGGPLLNASGEVIGINTVKVASAEGIGFAIPINVAVPIIKHLVEKGEFIEPYLGVFAYDKDVIPYLDGNVKLDNGIYIANIDQSGPAFKSGICVGCIIKQVDGINMNTMMQLRCHIYSKNPGDIINITHIDHEKNQLVTIPVILSAKEKDGLITR